MAAAEEVALDHSAEYMTKVVSLRLGIIQCFKLVFRVAILKLASTLETAFEVTFYKVK